jgi:hypothetical protein
MKLLKTSSDKKKQPNGKALSLVVGGAAEFTFMEPKTLDLVLKERKGYAKIALTTGCGGFFFLFANRLSLTNATILVLFVRCALVPVLTFGENDLYVRIDTPFYRKLSQITRAIGRFEFPAVSGRWGTLLPQQVPLTTVGECKISVFKAGDSYRGV